MHDILNQSAAFDELPHNIQRCFARRGDLHFFPVGTELYKFTDRALGLGIITPWWSSARPLDSKDPGIDGVFQRAKEMGITPARFARVRSAVTAQWNDMSQFQRIRLTRAIYGFVGVCSNQRIDQHAPANVVFIGGAWQVYIPGLRRSNVTLI